MEWIAWVMLSLFPFEGMGVGAGKWLYQIAPFYRPVSLEFSLFAGGWPVLGESVRTQSLLLFEGGYNAGTKRDVPTPIPEITDIISITDLYFSLHALKEVDHRTGWTLYLGGGISWHTLRLNRWSNATQESINTEARPGFSLEVLLTTPITSKIGVFTWLRYSRGFPWQDPGYTLDPSRVQVLVGVYQDLISVALGSSKE